ncbi:MAG: 4-hydroxythreonine-4-phosphate dehydrogenase PdxA [Nitrospirae bacterium]|nr:4-hydroxythreonine-4-phosphate dehydrogenase PdxA [Nitrospirota bacterium]MBF0535967.1 4-hydroxythreonine-4-phosphate dehydrogenase PdxA [Nitrospirota bacterium]MBF0618057.1 4-hydroxythreonine-4-phosphate dehydrogenase PdxA [Nitrospirota bacterium]
MSRLILITQGDPGGIGPEAALRAYLTYRPQRAVFVGDINVIKDAMRLINNSTLRINTVENPLDGIFDGSTLNVVNVTVAGQYEKRRATKEGGLLSARCIEKAVELILNGEGEALVTAPISKEALKLAGIPYPGHTEMLAALTDTENFAMMLVGGTLRVMLVTIHEALSNVPHLITKDRVVKTLILANAAAYMLGIDTPKIAVSALNPHAGEAGLFGREEIVEIVPAIEEAARMGIAATGPFPADTLFYKAYRGQVDIVVAMYHDQGLIPLKMAAFESGVNITIGLPIIRTSPDHGTAYDIAYNSKSAVNPQSMCEAMRLAETLRPYVPTCRYD